MSVSDAIPEKGLSRFLYELREGGRKQANVVFALLFRDVRSRSKEDDYGVLSLIGIALEPAAFVLVFSLFFFLLRQDEVMGVPTFLYMGVSLTSFWIIRRSISTIPRAMRAARAFYSFPSVKPIDALLARYILEMALTIIGGFIVFFFLWWFMALTMSAHHILHALGIYLLLLLTALGLSLFIAVVGMRLPLILKATPLLTGFLFITSSVIHPAAELPAKAQYYVSFNPLAHAMELLRFYTLDMDCFPGASLRYFACFCLTCLFLGYVTYYANRSKVLER
jgi:capsular polysaccharide transport system permease protein